MSAPNTLGPYVLERRLGRGGRCEVFLARVFGASGFEKRVAVKTLLPELTHDGAAQKMFLDEARLQARLSHRNLVSAHDLGVDAGRYYVRLDWVDGVTLAQLLERGPLPEPAALFIATELCLGLDALHRVADDEGRPLGIVHRDLSSGNVLLSREGEVRLADFGIAKATRLKEDTHAGLRKGTYAYMSPEQARGHSLTPASDVFALATLLVELLTGRRVFEGPGVIETLENVREGRAAAVELGALAPLVARCHRAEPTERYASAEALRLELSARAHALAPFDAPALARLVGRAGSGRAPAQR
jgi:eukaryotic-like serine/threonine-protein kinase